MNIRVAVILILVNILNLSGAAAIEIGLTQEYGGSTSSYIYNSIKTIILCQSDGTDCYDFYGSNVYDCDAIGQMVMCGETISATAPPGTVLCDPPEDCEEGYFCGELGTLVSCNKRIVVPDSGASGGVYSHSSQLLTPL